MSAPVAPSKRERRSSIHPSAAWSPSARSSRRRWSSAGKSWPAAARGSRSRSTTGSSMAPWGPNFSRRWSTNWKPSVPDESQLIYDWNTVDAPPKPARPVSVHDETLRDGIQGPSVRDPDIEHKLRFLHLADELGVGSIDLRLPGSGPRAVADVERLAQEIPDHGLRIKPLCAARTLEVDIRPVVEISQRVGIPIEVAAFIGSSPIRQY